MVSKEVWIPPLPALSYLIAEILDVRPHYLPSGISFPAAKSSATLALNDGLFSGVHEVSSTDLHFVPFCILYLLRWTRYRLPFLDANH